MEQLEHFTFIDASRMQHVKLHVMLNMKFLDELKINLCGFVVDF